MPPALVLPFSLRQLAVPELPASSIPAAPPPSRSVDIFMVLFISAFLFLTALLLRLVPPTPNLPLLSSYAQYGSMERPSYETLLDLADRVGPVKTGLTDDQIAVLPIAPPSLPLNNDCAICREPLRPDSRPERVATPETPLLEVDYEKGEQQVTVLPCSDVYHTDCISRWLRLRPSCPLCRERFA